MYGREERGMPGVRNCPQIRTRGKRISSFRRQMYCRQVDWNRQFPCGISVMKPTAGSLQTVMSCSLRMQQAVNWQLLTCRKCFESRGLRRIRFISRRAWSCRPVTIIMMGFKNCFWDSRERGMQQSKSRSGDCCPTKRTASQKQRQARSPRTSRRHRQNRLRTCGRMCT